ncbi:hypothetical protein [Alteromonas sediminis]|uniref:hypothetical protein n=1 Tax=Alteromonas sediminis TaxID=2259342 RepID=UPI001404DBC0|nr:hypothetical protein [Alteromonas sediminis]
MTKYILLFIKRRYNAYNRMNVVMIITTLPAFWQLPSLRGTEDKWTGKARQLYGQS